MIDPDFDPLKELRTLQSQLLQQSNNLTQLARGFNQRSELMQQMIDQLNQQTDAINHIDGLCNELNDRLRLLEMVRQYETSKNTPTTTTETNN